MFNHQLPPQLRKLHRQAQQTFLLCRQLDSSRLPGLHLMLEGSRELLDHLAQEYPPQPPRHPGQLEERQLDLFPDAPL